MAGEAPIPRPNVNLAQVGTISTQDRLLRQTVLPLLLDMGFDALQIALAALSMAFVIDTRPQRSLKAGKRARRGASCPSGGR
jgi:hypothetical protein